MKTLKDENMCCASEVRKLARLTHFLEKKAFKMKGITSSQSYAISELYINNELPMSELSERLALDSSTLTRNIQKLMEKGLVKKRLSDEDKRVTLISLTCEGKIKAMEIKENFKKQFEDVLCNLPKEKSKEIFHGIGLLLEILEERK